MSVKLKESDNEWARSLREIVIDFLDELEELGDSRHLVLREMHWDVKRIEIGKGHGNYVASYAGDQEISNYLRDNNLELYNSLTKPSREFDIKLCLDLPNPLL